MAIKKKITRKTIVKQKSIIRLSATKVRTSQNLGNGFDRFVFTRVVIPPGGSRELSMLAPINRRVVSGGWSIRPGDPKTKEVFATESYPRTSREWVITVWNDTSDFQIVIPYFITKLR
ncbi:hypothetical protein [Paenibacillus sp. FSL H3-0310]|uniref:hypothetical protein n=1 Tax=Paenibacillus sp. FSL H3-0310 TaxID=2921429 RepID=UPI0030FC64E5